MAHLEWVIVPNSEVARFCPHFQMFFRVFPMFSVDFNRFFSPSYTIQFAILHGWAFSITDTSTTQWHNDSVVFGSRQLRHLSYSSTTCRKWSSRLPGGRNPFFLAKGWILVFEICLNINLGNFLKSRTFINYKLHSYIILVCPGSNGNHSIESIVHRMLPLHHFHGQIFSHVRSALVVTLRYLKALVKIY